MYILIIVFIILISISAVSASKDNSTLDELQDSDTFTDNHLQELNEHSLSDTSSDLSDRIINANDGDKILIDPGTYYLHDITLNKSITLQGNGNPEDIVIDGEEKSSIFLIRNNTNPVTFMNLTFINAKTTEFGGAISIEFGDVYVDNCNFINNTARINAGGISNYGDEKAFSYLHVNNSLFVNNKAGHDGGAITTCNAYSYVYNSVFIGNSAGRDGGAVRVSVGGHGKFEDCIFMYNYAGEWGGAYYTWSDTSYSDINRCIFLNNTAGTHGGAVMVSGNLILENSIIMNNQGLKTGGSFFIRESMGHDVVGIDVNNNLITDNYAPKGKETIIMWENIVNLYTNFNNNDWGDENPNDSSINDPDNVTSRMKVSTTSNQRHLLTTLNFGLLNRYSDLIGNYFPEGYLENIAKNTNKNSNTNSNSNNNLNENKEKSLPKSDDEIKNNINEDPQQKIETNESNSNVVDSNSMKESANGKIVSGNSTTHGNNKKAYELNETQHSVAKQSTLDIRYFIAGLVIVFVLLAIGYKRNKKEE